MFSKLTIPRHCGWYELKQNSVVQHFPSSSNTFLTPGRTRQYHVRNSWSDFLLVTVPSLDVHSQTLQPTSTFHQEEKGWISSWAGAEVSDLSCTWHFTSSNITQSSRLLVGFIKVVGRQMESVRNETEIWGGEQWRGRWSSQGPARLWTKIKQNLLQRNYEAKKVDFKITARELTVMRWVSTWKRLGKNWSNVPWWWLNQSQGGSEKLLWLNQSTNRSIKKINFPKLKESDQRPRQVYHDVPGSGIMTAQWFTAQWKTWGVHVDINSILPFEGWLILLFSLSRL